jgi:hypothetical protein
MPRPPAKAIHWKMPRITATPSVLPFLMRKLREFSVLSSQPLSLGGFLELGPTSLLRSGYPCTSCGTQRAALSGLGIKVRGIEAGCFAAPSSSRPPPWFSIAGCTSQECLRLLQLCDLSVDRENNVVSVHESSLQSIAQESGFVSIEV